MIFMISKMTKVFLMLLLLAFNDYERMYDEDPAETSSIRGLLLESAKS